MLASPVRYFILLLLCAIVTLPLRSQEPAPAKKTSAAKTTGTQKSSIPPTDNKKAAERKKLDLSSLPADAALVICERASDALDLLPKAVILSPEKYQALLDQIAKLKKEMDSAKTDNTLPPTRCTLRGKVETNSVRLEAEFVGTAERTDTVVALACAQAGASSAETDGRVARIRRSESGGFLVRIDKPGEYLIKLDLLVPLATREGTRRGFELSLPRAVLTQLELDLPANCADVRIDGQRLKEMQSPGLELKKNHLSGTLGFGPADKLDLSWSEIRHTADDPVRTAEGTIRTRLDAVGLTTQADLWLRVEGAPAKVWSLLVPRNAEIKVLSSEKEGRIEHRIETADLKYASRRTIYLKEGRSEPLHVQIKSPLVPLPGSDTTMPIGPFFVLDAVRQTGTVQVRNQVRNLHLDYRGHGDMQLRRLEPEETKGETPATVATLVYSNIPLVADPIGTTGPKSRSWLDLEAGMAQARVRMSVAHTLMLRPSGIRTGRDSSAAPRQWEILTTITPATKWSEIEQLKIHVPANWKPLDEKAALMGEGAPAAPIAARAGKNPQTVTIPPSILRRAATQSQRLQGRYQASYQAGEHAVLKLPRPQGTVDSCVIKIEAPADAEVFLNNAEQLDLELVRAPRANEQTWKCRNVPTEGIEIDVSWRPYRPELRVASVVDVALNGKSGEVSQELRLQLPATAPDVVNLRIPAGIDDDLQIKDEQGRDFPSLKTEVRDTKSKVPSTDSHRTLRIPEPAKAGGSELRFTLHYRFSLTGSRKADEAEKRQMESFVVPLVTPARATGGTVKVRIWSEPGFLPRTTNSSWEERNIEEVKGRDLPVLVLQTSQIDAPLRLIGREQAAGFAVLVEEEQLRVQLLEGAGLNWRASFQLRQLSDRDLDILLPGPVATLNARFFLNRKRVTADIVNTNGEHTEGGDIARLRLSPDLVRGSALLEVSFHSPPGRTGSSPLRSILQPPRILRATAVPTCWQVSVPHNRVLLAPESGAAVERTWMRRGWLFAAVLSPLISSPLAPLPDGDRSWSTSEPVALVCWQDQTMPIVLTHAPQQGWLLVCSLGLLIVGLALYWTARPQAHDGGRIAAWFWPLIALLTLAIAIAALFWPTSLCAIAYGCEPGAVVLLAVLGVQWLMHQRYRRQIVFLSSFTRGPADSSLIRKTPSNRPPSGEPSTVDAPPPVG